MSIENILDNSVERELPLHIPPLPKDVIIVESNHPDHPFGLVAAHKRDDDYYHIKNNKWEIIK